MLIYPFVSHPLYLFSHQHLLVSIFPIHHRYLFPTPKLITTNLIIHINPMARKSNKSPSSHNTNQPESPNPTMSWTATNLLDTRDSHQSEMKNEKLEEIRLLFPPSANIVIPDSNVRADFYQKDWVCFYYYPFDIGLSFPFSPFIVDVLNALKVSPGQLMPFAWRTLACLDAIEAKHELGINVEVVKHSYGLKKFSNCRVGFVNRNSEDPLVLNNETVNDRNWKKSYFFVNKRSLGNVGDYLLDRWAQSGSHSSLLQYFSI